MDEEQAVQYEGRSSSSFHYLSSTIDSPATLAFDLFGRETAWAERATSGGGGEIGRGKRATGGDAMATAVGAMATATNARAIGGNATATRQGARGLVRDKWSTFCHKRSSNNVRVGDLGSITLHLAAPVAENRGWSGELPYPPSSNAASSRSNKAGPFQSFTGRALFLPSPSTSKAATAAASHYQ